MFCYFQLEQPSFGFNKLKQNSIFLVDVGDLKRMSKLLKWDSATRWAVLTFYFIFSNDNKNILLWIGASPLKVIRSWLRNINLILVLKLWADSSEREKKKSFCCKCENADRPIGLVCLLSNCLFCGFGIRAVFVLTLALIVCLCVGLFEKKTESFLMWLRKLILPSPGRSYNDFNQRSGAPKHRCAAEVGINLNLTHSYRTRIVCCCLTAPRTFLTGRLNKRTLDLKVKLRMNNCFNCFKALTTSFKTPLRLVH